jgi:thiol-disulfide isomerase/thioredoxin
MVLINKAAFDYRLPLGSALSAFSLLGTDEKMHSEKDFTKSVLVIAFWCNHCPYVKAVEHAFQALVRRYGKDVDFVAINSNEDVHHPEDSFEAMKARDVPYHYLRDQTQRVAKEFGAECTPHVFVFGKDRKLAYQGRVDDAGQDARKASTHELQDAIEDMLAGKKVRVPLTAAMGCSIKWL